MSAAWTVVYDDPKRRTGPSHTLHLGGCGDALRAASTGAATLDFEAEDQAEALVTAQYQGLGESADLGAVAPAPCVARGRR